MNEYQNEDSPHSFNSVFDGDSLVVTKDVETNSLLKNGHHLPQQTL